MPDSPPSEPPVAPGTRGDAVALALEALDRLAELGEGVEDEWTYVTALAEAGRARLRAARGDAASSLALDRAGAVAALVAETARIRDAHRAIDWLSTLPAVVELAIVAPPARAATGGPGPRGG